LNKSDFFAFQIDPNQIFDEIEFEPWITVAIYESSKREIKKLGFVNSISRSTMYDKPLFVLKL